MTLRDLGQKVNISFSQLGKIERGESFANSEQLTSFSKYFGVTIDYLLGLTDIASVPRPSSDDFKPVYLMNESRLVNNLTIKEHDDTYLTAKIDKPEDFFYFEINDNSMTPAFNIGEHVLIEFANHLEHNDNVAVIVEDKVLIRRLIIVNETKMLLTFNNKYEIIILDENIDYSFLGLVRAKYQSNF